MAGRGIGTMAQLAIAAQPANYSSRLSWALGVARDRGNRDAAYCFRIALAHLERGELEHAGWWAGHGALSLEWQFADLQALEAAQAKAEPDTPRDEGACGFWGVGA